MDQHHLSAPGEGAEAGSSGDPAAPSGASSAASSPASSAASPDAEEVTGSEHEQQLSGLVKLRVVGALLLLLRLGPVLILGILVLVLSHLSPVFATTQNLGNVLSQTAVIAILAIGQLLVI